MPEISSYCRACEGYCGVTVGPDGLRGDRNNPLSAGFVCDVAEGSLAPHPERFTRPMKREGGRLVPTTWEEAIAAIGGALKKLRKGAPEAVGLYAGGPVAADHKAALRVGAFALAMGTPRLFSPLCMWGGPKLRAAELVLGAPIPLQADVGRAHYTVLLGADQDTALWGPLQCGSIHTQALHYFRKRRKGTKLIAVDPQRTSMAAQADQHVRIRPGTELFYLLGLAHAMLHNRWTDEQYLRDYVTGVPELERWLEPWTPARCAEICGIEVGELAGVGLKFGRSAMSCIHAGPSLVQGPHGTLAAWAWLVVHALTANLLRPGGLYESGGLVDLHTIGSSFPSDRAPEVGGYRSLLLQAPATVLAEQAEGSLRALITVDGCPISELPERGRVERALQNLDLVVAIENHPSATTAIADWVLPDLHFWERADLHLLDHAVLPSRFAQVAGVAREAPSEARPAEQILRELYKAVSPSIRGGEWGPHLRLLGRWLAGADLDEQADRALDFSNLPSQEQLAAMPSGLDDGESDRAAWRPVTEDNRLHLAPQEIEPLLRALEPPPPADADYPLHLDTLRELPGGKGWRYRAADAVEPGIGVPAELGLKDGARVTLRTRHGAIEGPVRIDEGLHPTQVVVPFGWALPVGELLGGRLDPLSGAPEQAGIPCRIEPA